MSGLGEAFEALWMEWRRLPIPDIGVPITSSRRAGFTPAMGSGRTSSPAAACSRLPWWARPDGDDRCRLLVELGAAPGGAIPAVREARPGAIETTAQEAHARAEEPVWAVQAAWRTGCSAACSAGRLGDAFGYAVEFDSLEAIRRRFGPEGIREPVSTRPAVVSDDTQMTLFTLEGLLRAVGPDGSWIEDGVVAEVRRAYLDWLDTQYEGGARGDFAAPSRPGRRCVTAAPRSAVRKRARRPSAPRRPKRWLRKCGPWFQSRCWCCRPAAAATRLSTQIAPHPTVRSCMRNEFVR